MIGIPLGGKGEGFFWADELYHPGYYAAYLLDPDLNNIEAVHHGPTKRSATSVLITPRAA